MKKNIFPGLIALLATNAAFAQSSVTIYGLIDEDVRYQTNTPVTGSTPARQLAVTPGMLNGDRLGFKGDEDLGGGSTAFFTLEDGFSANNGTIGQQGQLFGREAFVGLRNNSLGEVEAGRLYGLLYEDIATVFDPVAGNNGSIDWEYEIEGIRFDNSIRYANTWGPLTLKTQYSFGGQAGEPSIGSTDAFSLFYRDGPLFIATAEQASRDENANQASIASVAGQYIFGTLTLDLSFVDAKRDPGFAAGANSTAAAPSSAALANTNLNSNAGNKLQRTDALWTAAAVYNITYAWAFTLDYKFDSVTNNSSKGDSGKVSTVVGLLEYNFSKRTKVYLELDHESVSGGEVKDANLVLSGAGASLGGATDRNGVSLGVQHRF